jgi:hypothetical protein
MLPVSVASRTWRRVLLGVTTLGIACASGCLKKASWLPNDHGGYTLVTSAESLDQAATRFRRSAEELCHGSRYVLSTPVVQNGGWSFDRWGGDSRISAQADLTCQ